MELVATLPPAAIGNQGNPERLHHATAVARGLRPT